MMLPIRDAGVWRDVETACIHIPPETEGLIKRGPLTSHVVPLALFQSGVASLPDEARDDICIVERKSDL